jgi:hypothetical protein
MRKHLPVRELAIAAALFAINAFAVTHFLSVPMVLGAVPIEYETDVQDGCMDEIDNDQDGLIDCGDPDCVGVEPCVAPAPALGPLGLVAGAVTLLVIGGVALRTRRREDQ